MRSDLFAAWRVVSAMTVADRLHLAAEVLVLGKGGAGLRGAIEARRHGAEVLDVSKMQASDPNCAAAAWRGVPGMVGGPAVRTG
jgi:succinate dehydrogenase/fumarate reductase flavoprotein subunit